jgi:serine O-acetyltransferase
MSPLQHLVADLRRYGSILQALRSPGAHASIALRLGQLALRHPLLRLLDPIYHVLNVWTKIAWGIDVSRRASIGGGLAIEHFGGVIVSPKATIGRNVTLCPNVVLGVGTKGLAPTVEDFAYIGMQNVVHSDRKIGRNSFISPCCGEIYRDVLPNERVRRGGDGIVHVSFSGNRPEHVHGPS